MPYVKLDSKIVTSSVWLEDSDTVRLWVYLLATADANGVVEATIPALALHNRLTVERTREILEKFAGPDPESRTPTNDGRRIEICREPRFGIILLNYEAHRTRAYTNAERQQMFRARHRNAAVTKRYESNESNNDHNAAVTQAEAEAEAEAKKKKKERFAPPSLEELQAYVRDKGYSFTAEAFLAHYEANGWKVGRNAMKDWHAACVTWQQREPPRPATTSKPPTLCPDCHEPMTKADLMESTRSCRACRQDHGV